MNSEPPEVSSSQVWKYLLIILTLGICFRVIALNIIPAGFNCDEAVNGYESFSILETLRDRYGKPLPAFFNVFGNDARESLYIYLSIPFIGLLGLNEFSTRLLAATIGSLTVLVIYFLSKEVFSKNVGLLAALMLAISPWHIHFSRIAFRLVLFPPLFCLGLLFFFKGLDRPKYLPLSAILFAISMYTYSSARVFVSIFLLLTVVLYFKHLIRSKIALGFSILSFFAIFLPLLRFWISPSGMSRARSMTMSPSIGEFASNYLSHFSPNFLLFSGSTRILENPTGFGELYLFEGITIFIGLLLLVNRRSKESVVFLFWILLYPIPSALVGLGSPQRAIIGAPLFAIISALGIAYFLNLGLPRFRKWSKPVLGLILAAHVSIFSSMYFLKYPSEASRLWNYGISEAIFFAEDHQHQYEGVVLNSDSDTTCFAIYDFIAHVPFFTKYSPEKYQASPVRRWVGGSRDMTHQIGNYYLMSLSGQTNFNTNYLYIVRPESVSDFEERGYAWKEVHRIEDKYGIEHYRLVKIRNTD